jgi:hypothetical protein
VVVIRDGDLAGAERGQRRRCRRRKRGLRTIASTEAEKGARAPSQAQGAAPPRRMSARIDGVPCSSRRGYAGASRDRGVCSAVSGGGRSFWVKSYDLWQSEARPRRSIGNSSARSL